ncbi:MAG: hypothetical protein MJ107_09385 [Lachnospiraceae bacterium]|nr:hypothetical protein [Lachnospiraceae bacterium]
MITLLFTLLMIAVICKMVALSIKLTWGLVKVATYIFLLPAIILAIAFSGLMTIALPVLIVVGLVALLRPAVD